MIPTTDYGEAMGTSDGLGSRSKWRAIATIGSLILVIAVPASAQTLAQCVTASDRRAAAAYVQTKTACQVQNTGNPNNLGTAARKAALRICLSKAKAANTRDVASGRATCKQNNPVVSASTAKNTQVFCRLVKVWLAAEEAGLVNPNVDIAWVHSTTDPLLAMFRVAPASIRADVGFIATAVYNSRMDVIVVEASQADGETEYARAMGQLIGGVEAGIASKEFPAALSRVSAFTKANCGLDLEATLKALNDKYLGS